MVDKKESTKDNPYWTDCYETARLPKEEGGGGCSRRVAAQVADAATRKLPLRNEDAN